MDNQNSGEQPEPTQQSNSAEAPPSPPPSLNYPSDTNGQSNIPQVISSTQKPKRRKKLKLLSILVILLLIAAGGWYIYQNQKENKNNPQSSTVASKEIKQLSVGMVQPDYGGVYPDIPEPNSYAVLINAQMFEGLVAYQNKSKIIPLLATDWSNPDSKTWLFNLRGDVKFHNGHLMQADDVKYSIEKIKKSQTSYADTFTSNIESVRVVNPTQVEIKTTITDPTLLNKLAFLYIIDAQSAAGSEPSQAGTGPYIIKPGTKPTQKNVQLVAYGGYYGRKPTTLAVNFGSEKDVNVLLDAYSKGKYDIVGAIPVDKVGAYSGSYQFTTREPEVTFLGFNTIKPGPLHNKKVREAIRYAVDPVKLGAVHGDQVEPISQLIPESIPGYNPALPAYKQDITKAKQLMKEAGYENGVTMRLSHSNFNEFPEELAKELKEIGINLKIDYHSDFTSFIDYFVNGKAEIFNIVYASDILDGLDIYQTTLTPANYQSSELDKILAQTANTTDPAQRLKLLQQAGTIVDKDIPVVPLSTSERIWLMNNDYDIVQDMPSSYLSVFFDKVQLK